MDNPSELDPPEVPNMARKCPREYMRVIDIVFEDINWLRSKINAGYEFVVLSPSLHDIAIRSFPSNASPETDTNLSFVLIVIKGRSIVPCRYEPTNEEEFFLPSSESGQGTDEFTTSYEPPTRIIVKKKRGFNVTITTPLLHQDLSLPLLLSGYVYTSAIVTTFATTRVSNDTIISTATASFIYLSMKGMSVANADCQGTCIDVNGTPMYKPLCTIVNKIPHGDVSASSPEGVSTIAFEIMRPDFEDSVMDDAEDGLTPKVG